MMLLLVDTYYNKIYYDIIIYYILITFDIDPF